MQKIGNITSTADANGEWTNGNVAAGTAPTLIDAAWLNTIQRELINIISAAGITIDPSNDSQVIAAQKKLFLQSSNNLKEIFNAGTDAISEARWNLLLNRFLQTDGDTQVRSPSGNQYLFVANNSWGVFDTTSSGAIPLPIGTGGTGATSSDDARKNLGLGDAAVKNTGKSAGTLAAGDDTRITGAMQKTNNLSDIQSYSTARSNMGLKGAALLDVGIIQGTVAAGDDLRITGAVQKASNLSDLPSASAARGNLGLGSAATVSVGTGANQIPDMNSFTSSAQWFKLPSGKIVQMGIFSTTSSGNTIINLPISFPTACRSAVAVQQDTTFPNVIGCIPIGANQLRATTWNYNGGAVSATSVAYIAIGD